MMVPAMMTIPILPSVLPKPVLIDSTVLTRDSPLVSALPVVRPTTTSVSVTPATFGPAAAIDGIARKNTNKIPTPNNFFCMNTSLR